MTGTRSGRSKRRARSTRPRRAASSSTGTPISITARLLPDPPDAGIGEQVVLVRARRGELRDDGPPVARLEPVERVRRERVHVAGMEDDLVPDGQEGLVLPGHLGLRPDGPLAGDIEIDLA